ncbi:MAG: CheR family methyltransferase [Archangium sp.]
MLSLQAPLLTSIVETLREHSGIDFDAFRRTTLETAIATRAGILGLSQEGYAALIRDEARERSLLIEACLVGHTSFFRDLEVMAALGTRVFPALARAVPNTVLRAWVVGAATGEEAWSLAMLLDGAAPGRFDMLATDVSESALVHAVRAEYPPQTFAPGFGEGFFEFDLACMRVRRELRNRVTFEVHDIVGPRLLPASAIVAHFDVVSCRNVLMWFDERFRRRALDRLAAVTRPGGILVLGRSESLPTRYTAFAPLPSVDLGLRIFERMP